jgi:hypothetical protein
MVSRRKQSRRNKQKQKQNKSFQRGGMAPFDYKNGLLLDLPTRTQAEVAGLDRYIADSQVLAKQAGGRRKSRRSKRKGKGRKGRKTCRKQRGGSRLADFSGSYELLPAGVARGVNPQFHTEGSVNSMYHEHKGAQA